MLKYSIKIIALSILGGLLLACSSDQEKPLTIGIIEPISHAALDEIVAGFKESFTEKYQKPVVIKVENAQNDLNLQRAIVQKMKDAHYDVVVPIGTTASQMAVKMLPTQTVVSLASSLSEHDRKQAKNCNVAVVHDEISAQQLLGFVHQAFRSVQHVMLIHSADEKVFKEVDAAIVAGKSVGITVSKRMVSSLSELYTAAQSLPQDIDAILILKDNLIASGASTLAVAAKQKKILFIASDEGSVAQGADIALGVREKQIGIEGGNLVADILTSDKKACDLPIVEMTALSVFVNEEHAVIKTQLPAISQTVTTLKYKLINIISK